MAAPIRVLLADDSAIIHRGIRTLLASESSIVVTNEVRNYAELLRTLNESNVDVVVMDVHMPDESKFDAASIKAHLRGSCLLAMSVFADEGTANLAQSLGALKLLDKMNLSSTLIPAIKECVIQGEKGRGSR